MDIKLNENVGLRCEGAGLTTYESNTRVVSIQEDEIELVNGMKFHKEGNEWVYHGFAGFRYTILPNDHPEVLKALAEGY